MLAESVGSHLRSRGKKVLRSPVPAMLHMRILLCRLSTYYVSVVNKTDTFLLSRDLKSHGGVGSCRVLQSYIKGHMAQTAREGSLRAKTRPRRARRVPSRKTAHK